MLKKKRLGDYDTIALSKECSAIMQKKLPPKLKDPSSFTIPCAIGDAVFEKALCDLGASINLMPMPIFKKLNLGEAHPTTVTLQLAYRSLTHPSGIIEDVLVKVNKFIFLIYFIILDIEEDKEFPIIMGRPFLVTRKAMIDVQKGELRLRVQEEEVTFRVFNAIKHLHDNDSCFRVDVMVAIVSSQLGHLELLKTSLTHEEHASCDDDIIREYVNWMDSFGLNKMKYFESLGASLSRLTPSIEKPPSLEKKPFPANLIFGYLEDAATLLVLISSALSHTEEERLLRVLR